MTPSGIIQIDEDTHFVDVLHQGRRAAIGTGVVRCPATGELALMDPGPEITSETLREKLAALGFGFSDVTQILVSHIHLDHCMASGSVARENPDARVFVHEIGAPHMVDPARLLRSAARIWGDRLESLWGRFPPVPEEQIVTVADGDQARVGDRRFEVVYTPGHARHHVVFFERARGAAWLGDAGGVSLVGGPVVPVGPPPEMEPPLWEASIDRILALKPDRLVFTHFGASEDAEGHFADLRARLRAWSARVKADLGSDVGDDASKAKAFREWAKRELEESLPPEAVEDYRRAPAFGETWWGLARYWRKQGA